MKLRTMTKMFIFCQYVSNCWLCKAFFSIFAQIKSFIDQCYPGNVTHVENRTICFRLGNTWKFTSEIEITTVDETEVNKSYYFEGVLSLEINFSLRLFPDYEKRREFIDKSLPLILKRLESCEIKEACVRDWNNVAETTVMPFWNIASFFGVF